MSFSNQTIYDAAPLAQPKSEMNPVLSEILKTGKVRSPDGELIDTYPSSIPKEKGEFLQSVIKEFRPVSCLEVGLAWGVSALFICDALEGTPNAHHIVIDPDQQPGWHNIGLTNLRAAGYEEMIEFYELPSYRVLPQLESQQRKIDFAFIDGWHTFDYALIDFFYIDRILRVGGIVVLDDTDWPSIRKLARYIATNHAYTPIRSVHPRPVEESKPELTPTDVELGLWGSCIAFRKDSDDKRRWDFFEPF